MRELEADTHIDKNGPVLGYLKSGRFQEMLQQDPAVDLEVVQVVRFEHSIGKEVFWHTSAHVLALAISECWPEAVPVVGPAESNGFFYDFVNLQLEQKDIPMLKDCIQSILYKNFITERKILNKQEATELFSNNKFKLAIINKIQGEAVSVYKHGEFYDLCRGPHIPNLGVIKEYEILGISGAVTHLTGEEIYVTRVHGISFPDKYTSNQYFEALEQAKLANHKLISNKLELFVFNSKASGMPCFLPGGMIIFEALMQWVKKIHREAKYKFIKTPAMMDLQVWKQSGHWEHYKDNMYVICDSKKEECGCLKAMNCPGALLTMTTLNHSYRDLPLRIFEFGHVFRQEASGSLTGLFRLRSFHQDDAHIFLSLSQVHEEIKNILSIAHKIYSEFDLVYSMEISTKPEAHIGTDEDWDIATQALISALDNCKIHYVENPGEGAFYGPKIDIKVMDSLGRGWQCGTIQLDLGLAKRFNFTYLDERGYLAYPVVIHRALLGSLERFIGILLEHFKGQLPFFINPRQVAVIPVADRHINFAEGVTTKLCKSGIEAHLISRGSVGKRVARAMSLCYSYNMVLGDVEVGGEAPLSLKGVDNLEYKFPSIDLLCEYLCSKYPYHNVG